MGQIPTLYKSKEEYELDILILGKTLQAQPRGVSELKEMFRNEMLLSKPKPSLEVYRRRVSEEVSDDYEVEYGDDFELGENEELYEAGMFYRRVPREPDLTVPDGVVVCFQYENQVTESLRDKYINEGISAFNGDTSNLGTVVPIQGVSDEEIEAMSATTDTWGSDGLVVDDRVEEVTTQAEDIPLEVDGGIEVPAESGVSESLGVDDIAYEEGFDEDESGVSEPDIYATATKEGVPLNPICTHIFVSFPYETEVGVNYSDEEDDFEDEGITYEDEEDEFEDEGITYDEEDDFDNGEAVEPVQQAQAVPVEVSVPAVAAQSGVATPAAQASSQPSGVATLPQAASSPAVASTPAVAAQSGVSAPTPIDLTFAPVVEQSPPDAAQFAPPAHYESLRAFVRGHPRCTIQEAMQYFSKKEIEKEILIGRVVKKGNKLHI